MNENVLFELFDAGVLWLDGSYSWSSVYCLLVSHLQCVASLGRHGRAGDTAAVPARQEVVEENVTVGDVRRHHGRREEHEREDCFPEIDAIRCRHGDNDVQPEVGEDAPGCGNEEDAQVLDLSYLALGDNGHTQTDDDKQVEGCTADDRAWTEVARVEPVTDHLNDRQHDLWRRRAERHQSQVGHRLVPNSHAHHHRLAVRSVHINTIYARKS